jgi:hypothetical protein
MSDRLRYPKQSLRLQRVFPGLVGRVKRHQITFGAKGVEVERSPRHGGWSSILTHEFDLQCAGFSADVLFTIR